MFEFEFFQMGRELNKKSNAAHFCFHFLNYAMVVNGGKIPVMFD